MAYAAISETVRAAIQEAISVPDYIHACANACRYDLMHGPSFVRIPWGNVANLTDDDVTTFSEDLEEEYFPEFGDRIEETYTGQVGNALRAFIDDLPTEAWVDTDCGDYMSTEPRAWFDEDAEPVDYDDSDDNEDDTESRPRGEWIEPDWQSIYSIGRSEIIEALFGTTIAREFA